MLCITFRRRSERSRLSLELQGRQMRLLLRGNQRNAEADVHDAAERSAARRACHVEPMKAFPLIKDLVSDVSWNFG